MQQLLRATAISLAVTFITAPASAQYDEWPMPAGTAIESVDASHGAPLALGDDGAQTLYTFDPAPGGALVKYPCNPAPYDSLNAVRVTTTGSGARTYWHGSRFGNRVAHITPGSPATCDVWTMPPGLAEVEPIDVDEATGVVWLATFDGVSQPTIAALTPMIPFGPMTVWTLPNAVAAPTDVIPNIDEWSDASGQTFVAFTLWGPGPGGQRVAVLDVAGSTVRTYAVGMTLASEVRADVVSGTLYYLTAGSAVDTIGRLDPSSNQLVATADPGNAMSPWLTLDASGQPWTTAQLGMTLDLVTMIPQSVTTAITPTVAHVDPMSTGAWWDRVDVITTTTFPSPTSMGIVTTSAPPFTRYSAILGTGAISADLTSKDVWWYDRNTMSMARVQP